MYRNQELSVIVSHVRAIYKFMQLKRCAKGSHFNILNSQVSVESCAYSLSDRSR